MVSLLVAPFRTVARHWPTITAFSARDIRSRYVNSALGLSWGFIVPLSLLLLYTFVFSYILKVRLGGSGTSGSFAVYLFCGMLPWLAFAEGVTRSTSVILEHAHLIKRVVFPSEILPAFVVLSALVTEFVGLGILLAGLGLFYYRSVPWTILLLPIVIALQAMLTVGLGWLLATLNVFLRDVGQLLGLGITLAMFLTPIFYPAELVPARFRWMLTLNPLYYLVEAYRALVLEQRFPPIADVLVLAVISLGVFVLGHWIFQRAKPVFVDVI
jgi:lipopolysaccharide transport system permease protein